MKTKFLALLVFASLTMSMGSKPSSATAGSASEDTDLKTSSEAIVEDADKKPSTPNATSEGVAERKGQTDPSGPHSYIGTRARGKALQTDKFPRPPEHATSGTTTPKTKY